MRDRILKDIMTAMKSQDKERLSVLRMIKGAMQLEEINKKKELDDNEMVALISKQVKTRKESIVEFEKGNRQDLIDQANAEIAILNEYMPEQLSDEEIEKIIDEAIAEVNPTGPSDMGKIMKILSPKLTGKADMSNVSKLVREKMAK
jgi:hypothetical protein